MSQKTCSAKPSSYRFSRKLGGIALLALTFALVMGGIIIAQPNHNDAYAAGATLTMSPLAGGPGTQLSISGKSFGANETVNIYWNYTGTSTGTLLTSITSSNAGSFTTNAIVPTGTAPGSIPIVAIGQSSNITASNDFYLYPPTLSLAPLSGSANTGLTLSAYGFQGFENVNIYWNNDQAPLLVGTTNIFGYLAPTAITVPTDTAPGTYPIKVVGQTTQISITNTFTVVAPGSSLNFTSGPVGMSVHVSGQGYIPNETTNIIWNSTGPSTGTTIATVNAGSSGTISADFTVPTAALRSYAVAVVGDTSGGVSQNTFLVGNGLASNPSTTPPNTTVTITGTGYQANEPINLNWDKSTGSLLATTTADANGNISQSITIPTTATPGIHSIYGIGQNSKRTHISSISIDTSWGDFGFDHAHHRQNPFENVVGTANASGLKLKWTATTAISLQSSPVYANGIVYMATNDGILYAYDAIKGTVKWNFDSHTGFEHVSSPLVDPATGTVFFGTVGARQEHSIPSPFYALDAQTGQLKWSLILPWDQFGFPTLSFHTIYLGTSHQGLSSTTYTSLLYAIDEISGHILWKYATKAGVWGAVAVDVNTNTVFTGIGDPAYQVLALDATTGAVRWIYTVPHFGGDDDPGSGIVVTSGLVYVDSKNGSVYAIHESDGSLAWSTQIAPQSSGDVSSPAIDANGVLYVGSHDHNLYALNATTGAVIWQTSLGLSIDSSPAVANGVVYITSYTKRVYAVDASSGTILWSFKMGGKSYSSPIMVNGWLYCGSTNGKLYAFSL